VMASGAANKVIDCNFLSGKYVILLQGICLILHHTGSFAWRWTTTLFSILTSGTFWRILNDCCCSMQPASCLRVAQHIWFHQMLNLLVSKVSQMVVPLK
jgi:hypothetical protein